MPDERSREEKLLAMAQQDESPHERDRARAILERHGLWPPAEPVAPILSNPFGAAEVVNEYVVMSFDAAAGDAELMLRDARTGQWVRVANVKGGFRLRVKGPFG